MMTENEYLKFADDTVLNGSKAYQFNNEKDLSVLIHDDNIDFAAVFNLLIDPEKTKSIIYYHHGIELVFDGYMEIVSINKETFGFSAVLTKGA